MKKLLLRISIPVFILIFASSVMAASLGGFGINPGGFWKQIGNNLSLVNSAFNVIVNSYLNFGTVGGETGYGIRDNSGAMEVKDDGGAWAGISTLGSISATAPLQWASGTGIMSILQSGTASDGYLNSTDWNIFNNKLDNVVEDTTPELGGNLDALTNDISNVGTLTVTDLAAGTVAISSGVTDRDIIIGYNAASLADESVIFNRFGETNAVLLWDETNDEFNFNDDLKIDGSQVIDTTNAEALLVRKDGDAGNVFTVDTVTNRVSFGGPLTALTSPGIDIKSSGLGAYPFKIESSQVANSLVYFHEDGSGDVRLYMNDAANVNQILLDTNGDSHFNGGNVGIGTASPTGILTISNNNWIAARNAADSAGINMFKVNASDTIDVGAALNVGTIALTEDSGDVTLVNLPVSGAAADGTSESYSFAIDSEQILTVKSLADGTGGIDTKQILLATTDFGTTAAPSIAFGDGDTGFYESEDDTLLASVGGNPRLRLTSTYLDLYNAQGATLLYGNPSGTVPVLLPEGNDPNTGIGHVAADNLSLIAGALESLRAEDPADLAATETSLWLYDADNGTIQQVTVGADDGCGAGFKCLRIAN